MEKEAKWNELSKVARALLLNGQQIDINSHYIQLTIEPTFTNKYTLQFVILKDDVIWYKTIWNEAADRANIYNNSSNNYTLTPTLINKLGSIEKSKFESVCKLIKQIKLPLYTNDDNELRDGEIYHFKIGYRNSSVTYTWHYLPDNWNELQNIAGMLQSLQLE